VKATSARRKGLQAEAQARDYLCSHGLVCERIPCGAAIDRGDLVLVDHQGDRFCVQVKHYADTARAVREGLAELPGQMEACGALFGFVIQRPAGVTDPARWRVVMTLEQMVAILKGAA
jgi:hypothetical protein